MGKNKPTRRRSGRSSTLEHFTASEGMAVQLKPDRIFLDLVDSPQKKRACKHIVEDFHSYRAAYKIQGRSIEYLVYNDDVIVGTIAFADSATPLIPGTFRRYIQANTMKEICRFLPYVVLNQRFTMKVHGLGGRVLALGVKLFPKAWQEKYGKPVFCVHTMVRPPHKGTIYKACGWDFIGYTSGSKDFQYLTFGPDASGKRTGYRKGDFSGQQLLIYGKWLNGGLNAMRAYLQENQL